MCVIDSWRGSLRDSSRVDELGIEPGPALQQLERAILRQERELDSPVRAPDRRRPRHRRRLAAVALGCAAAGIAALALMTPAVATRFRYELTPLRPHVRAVVAAELAGNRFTIQTDEPHVKVAWRLVPLAGDAVVRATEGSAP